MSARTGRVPPRERPSAPGRDGLLSASEDGTRGRSGGPRDDAATRRAGPDRASLQDRLKEGRELVVQVVREAFGGKGPRVTCFITLPGRYLVYAPQAPFRGVSRRIHDPEERQRLRDILTALPEMPGGFIVRTNGEGAPPSAFEADARFLVNAWRAIDGNIARSSSRRPSSTPISICSCARCATPPERR